MPSSRADLVRQKVQLSSDEGWIVSRRSDVRWLTGFTGSSGVVLVLASGLHLFTDGRYSQQAEQEAPGCTIQIVPGTPLLPAAAFAIQSGASSLQLQGDDLAHALVKQLQANHSDLLFSDSRCDIAQIRASKDAHEVASIKEALRITEQTFLDLIPIIKEGITENDLAAEIDFRQRKMGAEKSSFETIVAFGAHSALAHARPGKVQLRQGMPILLDFGCVVDGYASDMTRMAYMGEPTSDFLASFGLVLKAMNAAKKAARSGMTGRALDSKARGVFEKEGQAHLFCHSLGHGVGLEIHEQPSISSRNEDALPSDCVVTIEPGLYIPGQYGIRLEDMMLLSPSGGTLLNTLPTKLVVI